MIVEIECPGTNTHISVGHGALKMGTEHLKNKSKTHRIEINRRIFI
jgi:hypothetical protein